MSNRTDLATELENVDRRSEEKVEFITLGKGNSYNKPSGSYATVKVGDLNLLTDFKDIEKSIIYCLERLMPPVRERVLVVGLGNREIISDCIGPFTAEKILATRHIAGEFAENIGLENLKSVSVIAPGVLGKTGIEAAEIVKAVANKIKPNAVIAIDALCAKLPQNLFSVIQLCDSGISPGSGVKNARKELSLATLGVPTVAIGVPTVVEAAAISGKAGASQNEAFYNLLLTPKDTDLLSHRMSEILSKALNLFLQPSTEKEILLSLV